MSTSEGGFRSAWAEARGETMEEAIKKCVKVVEVGLGEAEHVLCFLLVNETPHLSDALPLEGLSEHLPPAWREMLVGAVSSPQEVARGRVLSLPPHTPDPWAALHCLALPSASAVQLFHAPNDSLPDLDYRPLLTDAPPAAFLVVGGQGMQVRLLLQRVGGVFGASPHLGGVATSSHLLLRSHLLRHGAVGLAFSPSPHGDAAVSFCRRLLANAVLQDVHGDLGSMQALFVPAGRVAASEEDAAGPLAETEAGGEEAREWGEGREEGEAKLREGKSVPLPLFVLKWQTPVVPGQQQTFRIFEPRYRLMVKGAVERGEPLVLVGPDRDVGTALRVESVAGLEPSSGCCVIQTAGLARVRVAERWVERDTFGLTYGAAREVQDESLEGAEAEEAEALRKGGVRLVGEVLGRQGIGGAQLERLKSMTAAELSMWLIDALRVSPEEAQGWFAETSPLLRLRQQLIVLEGLLARSIADVDTAPPRPRAPSDSTAAPAPAAPGRGNAEGEAHSQ